VVDLSTQGTAYLQSVQQVDQQIAELNVQLDLVNRAKSYMQNGPNQSGSLPAMVDIGDARLSNQINELNKTDLELNRQLQLSGPDNPRVKVLEDQSRRLRTSLNEGLGNISKNLESSRNFYVGKQSTFNSMLRSIPQKEKGLIDITRQQTIKNGIFSFLLQRREEAAIAVAGTVANSQFIRKPMYAGILKPTGMKTLLLAIPLALFLFFIFIALKEMFRNSLEEKQEMEKQVGAPIVGELSLHRKAKGEPDTVMVVGEGKQTIEAEQFRDLRTNLNYLGLHKDNKVVLVTSSMPGEGKTYVSINLAISLALTGKKVALLALDLRRPKISKEVGISPVPGITEYLIGNAKLDDIIKPMPGFHSLFLLPEGSLPPNPAELLMDDAMGRMVSELKQRFDYIIFDSPPIGAVTDAKVLANYANVSVYVTRVGRTLKSFFPMIKESYERKILPNMGVVVNGIKFSKMSRYGQRYGYAYERKEEKS
jgi:capsular exopolysaccharide synthesis family protein